MKHLILTSMFTQFKKWTFKVQDTFRSCQATPLHKFTMDFFLNNMLNTSFKKQTILKSSCAPPLCRRWSERWGRNALTEGDADLMVAEDQSRCPFLCWPEAAPKSHELVESFLAKWRHLFPLVEPHLKTCEEKERIHNFTQVWNTKDKQKEHK